MAKIKSKQTLTSLIDLRDYLEGLEIVNASWGPRGEVAVLAVDEPPKRIDGVFVPTCTEESHTYRIAVVHKGVASIIELPYQKFNYHFVQPIEANQLLLVGSRCRYYGNGQCDLNAKVFSDEGILQREFILGDGISDVKITRNNVIWTSYFDEGVYGNYGWSDPIGVSPPGIRRRNDISPCHIQSVASNCPTMNQQNFFG